MAVVGCDEAVDGDRDVGGVGGVAGLFPGFAVGVAVLGPVLDRATDGIERVWCSPKPKKSSPTSSATCTASSTFRMAWEVVPGPPSDVGGVLPNE